MVVLVEAGSRRGVRREELRLSSFHRHDKLDYAIRTCTSSSSSSRSLPFATAPKSESLKILGAKAVRALLEELRAAMIKRLRAPFLSGPFFPACSHCCSGATARECASYQGICTCCAGVGFGCCNDTYEVCHLKAPQMPHCEDCCGGTYAKCIHGPVLPTCVCGNILN